LWYSSKKSKPKPFSAFSAHPWAFSEPILRKNCDTLVYDNLIEESAWNLWKLISRKVLKLWSAIFHKYFGHHFEQDHHSQKNGRPTTSLFIMNMFSPSFEHTFMQQPVIFCSRPHFVYGGALVILCEQFFRIMQ
jgi:hypothetical protein